MIVYKRIKKSIGQIMHKPQIKQTRRTLIQSQFKVTRIIFHLRDIFSFIMRHNEIFHFALPTNIENFLVLVINESYNEHIDVNVFNESYQHLRHDYFLIIF